MSLLANTICNILPVSTILAHTHIHTHTNIIPNVIAKAMSLSACMYEKEREV